MRRLRSTLVRLIHVFNGKGLDREFAAELESHLQLHVEGLVRAGVAPGAARRQALLKLGGIEMTKERHRDQRGLPWVETAVRDVRFGFRLLRKNPGFAAIAIATLALTIGANTAIYTLVDHVLLRPLPYPQPDRLATVVRHFERGSLSGEGTSQDGKTWFALRDGMPTLDLAVSGKGGGVNLVADDRAQYVQQQRVSSGFFRVLGIPPAVGREFTTEEDRVGGPAVVILSHALWTRLFAADPGVIGHTVTLRGEPFTVVGVMPAAFRFSTPADLWTPVRPSTQGEGGGQNYLLTARLRPGVTWADASGQVESFGSALLNERFHPGPDLRLTMRLVPLQRGLTSELREPLFVLWAAVGMVLLIGCVNIAGLMLVRCGARAPEMATRMALGGGRSSIVRQLLAESFVLAACGGLAGIALGYTIARLFSARLAEILSVPTAPDVRVLIIASAASLFTCVLFGLFPAVHASRADLRDMLVESGGASIAGPARRWPARLLVITEVALGVMLFVGAGLLIRTFAYLTQLPPGFDATNAIAGTLSLQDARYQTSDQVNDLFTRTLDRIHQAPGVERAAVALTLPYERALNQGWRFAEGANLSEEAISVTYVTPEYFSALRIPMQAGRLFNARDTSTSTRVLVVNDTFVRRYSRDNIPLGRRLMFGTTGEPLEIVGVVGAIQQRANFGGYGPVSTLPAAYVPAAQFGSDGFRLAHTWFSPNWIVRTAGPPSGAIAVMQSALRSVDSQLPFNKFRTIDDVRREAVTFQRIQAAVLSTLAGLALLLATLGVYGLVANSVAQRSREFGLRIALGATPRHILKSAATPGIVLGVAGILIGLTLASASARVMQRLVFGVPVNDPLSFAVAAGVVFAAACASAIAPAVRVLRLNVITTLRQT